MHVGENEEKFLLEYEFNQLFGNQIIKINNQIVKKTRRWISAPVRESHELDLGEHHLRVRIENERRNLFGLVNRVFVNDRLIKSFEGV